MLLCRALAGCAIGPSFEGDASGAIDRQPTGTIAARPTAAPALPGSLDEEDRRRAMGALAIALDPQGNGAPVHWDNPQSKAHGQIAPVGYAFPNKSLVCRKFTAQVVTAKGAREASGSACRDKNADWTLAELKPNKPD